MVAVILCPRRASQTWQYEDAGKAFTYEREMQQRNYGAAGLSGTSVNTGPHDPGWLDQAAALTGSSHGNARFP
jgi:hypothetical protein